MKQITEQMLQDRFAVGFMFGVMAAILGGIIALAFNIIYSKQKYKQQ